MVRGSVLMIEVGLGFRLKILLNEKECLLVVDKSQDILYCGMIYANVLLTSERGRWVIGICVCSVEATSTSTSTM